MKLQLVVAFAVVAIVQAKVGEVCKTDSQCDAGECCQTISFVPIMSKRQLVVLDPNQDRTGTCQLYKTENQPCGPFEKRNGYCSCAPGLSCHMYEVKVEEAQITGRRSMIAPHPGYMWQSECWSEARIAAAAAATTTPAP